MSSSLLIDIDPDISYYNQNNGFMYYSVDHLSRICAETGNMIINFNCNVRSFISNNATSSDAMFALFNCSKSDNSVNIHQYNYLRSVREFQQSVRISACVKAYYMSEKCNELSYVNDDIELCAVLASMGNV